MAIDLFDRISRVSRYLAARSRTRHHEVRYTVFGVGMGLIIGFFFIGGVGIAAFGLAWGFSGAVLLAVLAGLIGSRLGIGRDKKDLMKANSSFRAP